MIRYFLRGFAAHFRAGRSLFALSLLGVALGVASVLSIQIININALGAFKGSLQAISGEADLSVVGRAPVLDEALYPVVLSTKGVKAAWPLYRVQVTLAERQNLRLEIYGLDLFAPMDIPWKGETGDLSSFMSASGWVALTPPFAEEMGLEVGDRFEVTIGSRRVNLLAGALVDFRDISPLASDRLAVMDIAQAQALLGDPGEIHQIDLQIEPGIDRSRLATELQSRLGTAAQILTPEQREQQAATLLSSFRLNLTALSLISLFVGGFLIYSTTQASLVRRRFEFGLLRSIGATRGQLLSLILGETSALGLMGVVVGIPMGYYAAASYVGRVSSTLSNVYVLQAIETLEMPVWLLPLSVVIGLFGALAGSIVPALDVSRQDTRSLLASFTLHERMGAAARPLFVLGWVVLAGAGVLARYQGDAWQPGGFVLAVGLILTLPLITPFVVQQGARLVRVRSFGLLYGLKGLGLQLQTTPFAIAALAVAVAMMVGITIMVGSFRQTLAVWVGQSLRADIYVTSESWRRGAREATLAPELVAAMASHPGVRGVDVLRQFFIYYEERRISPFRRAYGLAVGRASLLFHRRRAQRVGSKNAGRRRCDHRGASGPQGVAWSRGRPRSRDKERTGGLPRGRCLLRLQQRDGSGNHGARRDGRALRLETDYQYGSLPRDGTRGRAGCGRASSPFPGSAARDKKQPPTPTRGLPHFRTNLCRHPAPAGHEHAHRR